MKIWIPLLLTGCLLQAGERVPLTANYRDSASWRWLNKKVLDSRVLDDMESLTHWTVFETDPQQVVDARVQFKIGRTETTVAKMSLTTERSRDGGHSLRMVTPTKLNQPGPKSGRTWGESGVVRHFDGEDWTKSNRISLWVYPDWPGFYTPVIELHLWNDGVEKLPAPFAQEGQNNVVLRNHEWNHIVWEISNCARDKVTGLEIAYNMAGNEPEAADILTTDFDRLELERVDPDHIEGWNVWPGRIAFSHAGYQLGATKTAIASDLKAREFELVNQDTGNVVLTKPIQAVKAQTGQYQVMDFSEVRTPGNYVVRVGGIVTQPFRIGEDAWRDSIFKALNFFYAERCGYAVPGVHSVCHQDWSCVHGDKRMMINGGWHDAGDMTQGLGNTGEATYAMFSMAERLHAQGQDPELYERLVEEARWGLDWILKTSFGDGYRNVGSISSRRTNNIMGDFDDIVAEARNQPLDNFVAAAAEALGSRVLKERDPRIAAYSLKMAEADWAFGVAGLASAASNTEELWHGTFDSGRVMHEPYSIGILAAVDLWRATGNQRYVDKAAEMAKVILDSQERNRQDWDVPMLGFFYTSPAKDRILHYVHRGREQAPILALTALCDAFPGHADWMRWYSAVTLHSEYLKTMAKYTEPYDMIPSSIYKDDEYKQVPEGRRDSFRQQVLNGVPLGQGHYLRLFAVWLDYRGQFGTILPQAQALSAAARLRGDMDSSRLSEHQLEWVLGRNPFSESAMWGAGYDFAPQYTPSSGDIVGSLPVGFQTRGTADVPYWPIQNVWTYKEIWVHPVTRWIWLLRDLAGPALVEGQAAGPVEFVDLKNGDRIAVQPDSASGHFRTSLPEGQYRVRTGGEEQTRTFLPGSTYALDLRPGRAVDFQLAATTTASGEVTVKLTARGTGSHQFAVRMDNVALGNNAQDLTLRAGEPGMLVWHGRVAANRSPWVAVIVPDSDLSQRKEVRGATWER